MSARHGDVQDLDAPGQSRTGRVLAANGVANVLRGLSASLLTTGLPIVFARSLDLGQYRAWTAAFGAALAISYLDFGVLSAVSALVGRASSDGRASERAAVVRSATVVLAICSTPVLGGYVAASFFAGSLFPAAGRLLGPSLGWSLAALAAAQTVTLFVNIPSGYYSGLQRSHRAAGALIVCRVATLIALSGVAVMTRSVVAISCGYLIAAAVTSLVLYGSAAREVRLFGPVPRATLRRLFAILRVSSVQSIAMMVVSGVDIIIVSAVDYPRVGQYGLASSFSLLLTGLVGAMISPILPHISKTMAQAGESSAAGLALRLAPVISVFLTWLAFGFGLSVAILGPLIAGNKFGSTASVVLVLLSLSVAVRQFGGPVAMGILVSTTRRRVLVVPAFVEAVTNLGLSVLLGREFGAAGVSAGTLLGAVAGLATWCVMLRHADSAWRVHAFDFAVSTVARGLAIGSLLLVTLVVWRVSGMDSVVKVAVTAAAVGIAGLMSLAPAKRGAFEARRIMSGP